MTIQELIKNRMLLWLLGRGINAVRVSFSECVTVVEGNYGEIAVDVYYYLPDGKQGSIVYWGSLESFIDDLDTVEVPS